MSVSFYQHVNKSKNSRAGNELCKKLGTKDYKSGGQKLTLLNYQLRVGKRGDYKLCTQIQKFSPACYFLTFCLNKVSECCYRQYKFPMVKIDLNLSTNSNCNGKT